MGHLQDFLSFITHEDHALSKPFLYDVVLGWPSGMNVSEEMKTMMRLLCHQAEIPGADFMTKPNMTYGITYEIPYELQQHPIGLTFYVDSRYEIPKLFKDIKNATFNEKDYSPKYRTSYQFQCNIFIYDANNMVRVAEYTLKNAFFKGTSSINLAYNALDNIQTVQVELVYDEISVIFNNIRGEGVHDLRSPSDTTFEEQSYEQVPGFETNIPLNFETYEVMNPTFAQQFSLTGNASNNLQRIPNQMMQLASSSEDSRVLMRSLLGGGNIGIGGNRLNDGNILENISTGLSVFGENQSSISSDIGFGRISSGNGLGNLSGLGTRGFAGGGSDRAYNNIDAIRSAFGIM